MFHVDVPCQVILERIVASWEGFDTIDLAEVSWYIGHQIWWEYSGLHIYIHIYILFDLLFYYFTYYFIHYLFVLFVTILFFILTPLSEKQQVFRWWTMHKEKCGFHLALMVIFIHIYITLYMLLFMLYYILCLYHITIYYVL